MKIFAAGIATETNTFCPIPTSLEDFVVQRSADAPGEQTDLTSVDFLDTWRGQARDRGDSFVSGLMAWAQPSGITTKSSFENLRDEILLDLQRAMPVDIVLLQLHGAMVAQGYDDCEQDIIRCIRETIGSDAVLAVELDLHCHLSQATIEAADIVITYKEYPHVDCNDRARELFDLAVQAKLGNTRPTMALFDCRMVGIYPTNRQPLRSFVDAMIEAEQRDKVLSISFGHGYQFADVPDVGAKVLVVTDNDRALARQIAQEFGIRAHGLRHEIGFETLSLPMEQALSKAVGSARAPVVIADQSDNIGGGAPGDATFALRWLLDHGVKDAAIAILYDPEVVKIATKAGIGATLPVRLGGKLSPFSGDPIDIDVIVRSVLHNYLHGLPQQSGNPWLFPAGDIVALSVGDVDIVVSSKRCQCFEPKVFSDLGIDATRKHLLIVKSAQHFYGAFSSIAGEVVYMAARGAVVPDPRQISYRRLDTSNMYPWVEHPVLD